jgi:hypothetical protein
MHDDLADLRAMRRVRLTERSISVEPTICPSSSRATNTVIVPSATRGDRAVHQPSVCSGVTPATKLTRRPAVDRVLQERAETRDGGLI